MDKFIRKDRILAYDSTVVALYKDILQTPEGDTVVYDFIKHKAGGGAGILLVDQEEYTYLVKQYRNAIDDISLEIPAGGYADANETGEQCAVREAEEETGWIPQKVVHISNVVSAIGTFDETTDIFLGYDLKKGRTSLDEYEYIDLVRIPVKEAIEKVFAGEIIDGKTVTALFAYEYIKNNTGHK